MQHPGFRPLIGPAALAIAGFALSGAAPAIAARLGLAPDGGLAAVLRAIGGIGGWLALAWAGARLFDILLLRASLVARRPPYPRLLGDMVRVVLFAAAVLAILMLVFEQSGFGFVTTSSVAVAVIGFALRNIISDVFSGIALGIDHPYRIGDWIETAQGTAGRVVEVSWRATRLVTRDGVAVTVPNGLIAANRLVNYGPAEGRYRVALRVPLDPALPPERARRILLAAALDAGRNIPGLAPDVVLQEVAEGAAIWMLRFHVPNYGKEAACRDAVATAVLRALQHVGLGIARPARDLHLERARPLPARPRREALLRRIELFRGFPAEERAELEQAMRERLVRRGTIIVRQGEPGASLFVLAEGALDVKREREGAEVMLDRMVPGDVFGEMSLLTGQPRSATVSAATDAVVFEIAREDLDPILRRRPELAEGLAAIMASRQERNAGRGQDPSGPEAAEPAGREDLLGRLRAFFRLG
ncbi:MAG: mechanosensitive ion channel family protein [Acetobacteraceae bacterium]|nr:mechanosensitive ion channel family protein [Acetobacteraceae bacterium]